MSFPSRTQYNHAANQQRKAADIVEAVQTVLLHGKAAVDAGNQNPRNINRQVGFDVVTSPLDDGAQLQLGVSNTRADRTNVSHVVDIRGETLRISTIGEINGEETTIARQVNVGKLNADEATARILADLSRNEPGITGHVIQKAQEELTLANNPALARYVATGFTPRT